MSSYNPTIKGYRECKQCEEMIEIKGYRSRHSRKCLKCEKSNTKKCNDCGKIKSVEEFWKGKKICRECSSINKLEYYKENRERIIEQKIEYYKNNPKQRMARSIGRRLSTLLKTKKGFNTYKLLGYEPNELFNHIEKQFNSEMNWDNYGSYWHLDHIIPVNLYDFDIESHITMCNSIRNLRPLEKKQNLSKGDSLIVELVEKYNIEDLIPIY